MAGTFSPASTSIGTPQSEGIVVIEASGVDAPGAIILATSQGGGGGGKSYNMLWVDENNDLRILEVTGIYNQGSQVIDLTGFDQNSSGVVVGTQT